MTKKTKNTIFVTLFGLALIIIGLFTDYTLTIFHITIPKWLTIVIGIVLILGWFTLNALPDKYDKDGKPLEK